MAEETGLIVPLGAEVMRMAIEQAKDWPERPERSSYASTGCNYAQGFLSAGRWTPPSAR
jgi:hypothetical protein